MPKSLTKEEAYDKCNAEGKIVPVSEVDTGKVESMVNIAEEDMESIKELKKKEKWNTLYKLNYDVLHTLCEALLMFEKTKSLNHQCLFSYVCVRFPELELDWNFFEKVRTKRNGIHYYGTAVKREDFKEIEVQMALYIKTIKGEIGKKLKEQE